MTWRQHPNNFDNPINPEYEQEARLVEQARAGSERAFSALLARYQQPVFRLIYHLVGDLDEARDLTRIALRHALVRMPRVPSGYSIRPWLLRVATLVALDAVRERSESPQALLSSLHLPPAPSPDGPRIVDSDPTMADTMLLSIAELEDQPEIAIANAWDRLPLDIERELIRRLLASLPEGDAELLALGVVGQVPTRDLAAIAGTSQRSIRRRIARALIMFQSQYQAIRTDALPPAPATKELPAASISGITAIDVARRGFAEASDRVKRGIRTVRANFSSEDAQERLETLRGDQMPPTPTPTTPSPAVGTGGARSHPTASASTPGSQIARNVVPPTQRPDVTRPMPVMDDSAPPTSTQETIIVAAAHVEPTAPVPEWTTPVPTLDDLAFATKAHAFGTADEHNRATTEATESMPLDTSATVARLESLRDVAPDATVILPPAPVEMIAEQTMILRTPMGDPIHTRQLPRFGPPAMANDALADVVVPAAASSPSGASPRHMTPENDEQISDETMILAVASSPTHESIPEAAAAEPEAVPTNTASDFERNALPVDAESPLGEAEIAAMAEDLAAVALDDAATNNLSTVYVVPAELIELSDGDDDAPDMPNEEIVLAVVDAPTERREIAETQPDNEQPLAIAYDTEHVPAAEIEHTAIDDATEHTAPTDVSEHVWHVDAAEHEAIADATEHTTDVPMIAFVAANVVADESVPLAEHSPESIPLDSALFGDSPSVDETVSAVEVPPTFVAENSVAVPMVASAEEPSPVDVVPNPDIAPNVLVESDAENAVIFVDATPTTVLMQPPSVAAPADTAPAVHDISDEVAAEHLDLLIVPEALQQTAPRGATTEHSETPITALRIDPMAEQQPKAEALEPLSEEPNIVAVPDATVLDATNIDTTMTDDLIHDAHVTSEAATSEQVTPEANTSVQATPEVAANEHVTPEITTSGHEMPEVAVSEQEALVDHTTSDEGLAAISPSVAPANMSVVTADADELHTEQAAANTDEPTPAAMLATSDDTSHSEDIVDPVAEVQPPDSAPEPHLHADSTPDVLAEAAAIVPEPLPENPFPPTVVRRSSFGPSPAPALTSEDVAATPPITPLQQAAPTVIVRRADDTVVVNDTARQQYIERHRIANVDMGDLNGITGITLDPQGELPEEAATPEKLPAHGISVVAMPVATPTPETPQPVSHDLADLAGLVPTTHADFAATTPEHDTLPPPTQRSRRPTRPMPHIDRDVTDSAHDW